MADHQIAHVYVADPALVPEVARVLRATPGIDAVLDRREQAAFGLDHPRSGELVAVAAPGKWFSYYFWEDDAKAPDYARCVDIHSKPGYDPVELFTDPAKKAMPLRIAGKLLRKKLGFRTVMDLIPLDASLVGGSHGRLFEDERHGPVILGSRAPRREGPIAMADVRDLALELVFGT
ncbi:MAG: hypothetical protein R3F20_16260 [Planctomycetota bacterium]